MYLTWLGGIASAILLLSCALAVQNEALQQKKPRDLSLYEKAEPYTLEIMLDRQTRATKEGEIREFLWNHWQQRKLGQLTVTRFSREGEPTASSYFIEPDEKGAWRIAVRIDRTLVARGGLKGQRQESLEYSAYTVDRVEFPKSGLTPRVLNPKQVRLPQSYRLALKDEKGETLPEI